MKTTTNLQDERIRYAFAVVDGWPAPIRKDAAQRVKGLPVELRTQGLVVSVATLMSGPHAHLADTVAKWLLAEAPHKPLAAWAESQGRITRRLLAACTRADRGAYLAAQEEALALVEHIKRFASALTP